MTHEVNFDGLIGPTHNYAGLALGNVASASNEGKTSNPKLAALQGLDKMEGLMALGLKQGFIPPLMRPNLPVLRHLGFAGGGTNSDRQIIERVARDAPDLLANTYSASAMWTANAATVAPSTDTADSRVHFVPANLASHFHRQLEADDTAQILAHIFADPLHFTHHAPIPGGVHFGDEGAANHGRFAKAHGTAGTHLFVFGEDGEKFPARQSEAASRAAARLFGLETQAVFLKQSKAALDAGAFHNDVVSVVNENVLFTHETAFEDQPDALSKIRSAFPDLIVVEAPAADVTLADAITSYLFNSQLVSIGQGDMALILPVEAQENERVRTFLQNVEAADNPINRVIFRDVRESMRNGGGPACLRLRVVLNDTELAAVNHNFLLDAERLDQLRRWVNTHYRDALAPDDLRDPHLMEEAFAALDGLTQILDMGAFYAFQR